MGKSSRVIVVIRKKILVSRMCLISPTRICNFKIYPEPPLKREGRGGEGREGGAGREWQGNRGEGRGRKGYGQEGRKGKTIHRSGPRAQILDTPLTVMASIYRPKLWSWAMQIREKLTVC
jgi:hypothetical protein